MELSSAKRFFSLPVLFVFFFATSFQSFANEWTYQVKPGDNIWDISERYLTSALYWKKLQALNNVKDPLHIPPGTLIKIPVKWLNKSPMVARLNSIVGSVTIKEDFNGKTRPIAEGEYVFIDDTLYTGTDSTATIEFVDGSRLLLQPNSHLKFDHVGIYPGTGMTDTRLKLEQGRVETQVAPKKGEASRFEISTPAGITSVRGTDYRVSAEPEQAESRTEVIGGNVSVTSHDESRLIHPGFGTIASASSPPKAPIKLLQSPHLKSLPVVIERLPIRFEVDDLEGANGFRAQVSLFSTFETVIFDQVFQGNLVRLSNLPDDHYYLRIRGIDKNLLEGLSAEHEFTLNARPEAPFLIEPKPDAGVTEESPRFVWAKLQSAQNYHFQIATDAAFTHVIVDADRLVDAETVSTLKLELGQYYWRVASKNDHEGLGPFSDIQSFRRILPAPEAEDPELSETSITMQWRAGLLGQKYQFQMADEVLFEAPMIDTTTEDAELIIDRPDSGEYFIRVRTIEPDGFVGPYGEPQAITIPIEFNYWWLLALPLLGLIAL